jgi:DNA (cytosine-5)-methyltransferase 1
MNVDVDVSPTLIKNQTPAVSAVQVGVRRLTPTECERLQGFPDGHTNVPHRGKPAADGPRYKALGNSMAVPVMHWIGRRIALLESVVPWDGSVSEVGSPKQIQTKDGVQYAFSWA